MNGKLVPPAIFTSSFITSLLELTADILLVLEPGGICRHLSHGAIGLLDYNLPEVLGENVLTWMHPQDRSYFSRMLVQAQLQPKTWCPPIRFRKADNQWLWLSGDIINMKHHPDNPGLVFLLKQIPAPIPEARLADQDRHREYYNTLFYNHPDAILTLNTAGIIIKGNDQALDLSGYAAEEYFGSHFAKLIPACCQEDVYEAFYHTLEGQSLTFETQLLTRNGVIKDISITSIPIIITGEVEGIQCIIKDITSEKQAQLELEQLSLVASKTTNGVIITDNQRRIEWVNEGFTKATGYTRREIQGLRPEDFLHGSGTDKKTVEAVMQKLSEQIPVTFETLNYNKKGEAVWFLTDVTPVLNEQGEAIKFISIRTDITEKKNRETELVSLTEDLCNQNRDLQQFTYIVSHNLRAPVANVLGLVNLLGDLKPEEHLFPEVTKNLKASILQLDSVIKDINLILSIRDNKATLGLEELEFKKVFTQVMHNLSVSLQDCQGQITLDVPEGFTFPSHKAYLFSILYNLLSNAIKYRSPHRPLEINVKCYAGPKKGTIISCSDNGLGMNLEKAGKNLFKLYKRFHKSIPGRGIGLYLVKTHIETLGGRIEVISSPDKGTQFTIYLP